MSTDVLKTSIPINILEISLGKSSAKMLRDFADQIEAGQIELQEAKLIVDVELTPNLQTLQVITTRRKST
jgi:hypothetical protein